jgi:hypothetical protein
VLQDEEPELRSIMVATVSGTMSQSYGNIPSDTPSVVPLDRWDVDGFTEGKQNLQARFGSFVRDLEAFDGQLFGLGRYVIKECFK